MNNNHPNRSKRENDYALVRCDATSPYHTSSGLSYVVTHRGRLIGHLDVHKSGYRDWIFNTEAGPTPSATTQRRMVESVRNDRRAS